MYEIVITDREAAARAIIEQCLWFGKFPVAVPSKMPQRGRPLAMRSLVLTHQQKGFGLVAIL